MTLLFVSDIHLSESRPEITESFEELLATEARRADGVYILGDLFEFWAGNDAASPFEQSVIKALRALADTGVPIFFMHGNRDFLIDREFATSTGCHLLPDPSVITLGDTRVALSHGDLLCTDDKAYQRFRRIVHNRWIQRAFLALSASRRRALAARIRARTRLATQGKPAAIMDVNPRAVVRLMESLEVRWLIHGHTHRPGIHHHVEPPHTLHRVVLGDWYRHPSILRIERGSLSLDDPRVTGDAAAPLPFT